MQGRAGTHNDTKLRLNRYVIVVIIVVMSFVDTSDTCREEGGIETTCRDAWWIDVATFGTIGSPDTWREEVRGWFSHGSESDWQPSVYSGRATVTLQRHNGALHSHHVLTAVTTKPWDRLYTCKVWICFLVCMWGKKTLCGQVKRDAVPLTLHWWVVK